jgi:outer membrane receptor for ferrienterochelin and colicins
VRRLHDTIATVTTLDAGRWTERRGNVGRAIVWGLEVDAKTGLTWLGLGADWTLSANASLLQSRMLDGVDAGSRIPGQARYTASASIAKPVPRAGGLFGGATLTLTGPAQLNSAPASGRTAARTSLDVYLGALVRGWGYWRVGVFNIGDAPFERTRQFVDGAGNGVETRSRMTLTPRVYLTVGTQF